MLESFCGDALNLGEMGVISAGWSAMVAGLV